MKKPEIEPEWEKSVKVAMLSSICCDRSLTTPCFIHEVYYLQKYQVRECHCGLKSEPIEFDSNLFAESVNMHYLLSELTTLSLKKHEENPPQKPDWTTYATKMSKKKREDTMKELSRLNLFRQNEGLFFEAMQD